MERTERIVRLHNILAQAYQPVARRVLEERLECSEKSVRRAIEFLRDRLGAPIEYDAKRNGYYYTDEQRALYQLPGLWLSEKEVYALLTIQQLINHFDPEFLRDEMSLLEERVQAILHHAAGLAADKNIIHHIHIIPQGKRQRQYGCFQIVASACLQRKRLHVIYHSRSDDQRTKYELSPQKLIFYRDNWYLAAYCHIRQALRPFSLDRLQDIEKLEREAMTVSEQQLTDELFSSFGIFSGLASEQAVLLFSAKAARWIGDEVWHPQQQGEWLADGRYRLCIPYSNPTELVGEILRRGDEVEVLEPESLRTLVQARLQAALATYQNVPSA